MPKTTRLTIYALVQTRNHDHHLKQWRLLHPYRPAPQSTYLTPPLNLQAANSLDPQRTEPYHWGSPLWRVLRFRRRLPRCTPHRLAPWVGCDGRRVCHLAHRSAATDEDDIGHAIHIPLHQRSQASGVGYWQPVYE